MLRKRTKTGSMFSLDCFNDEDDLELFAPIYKISDDALHDVMVDSFMKTREEHDPMLVEVFRRMHDGQTQRTIADTPDTTKHSIQTAVECYRKILQPPVTCEDIIG